MTVVGVDIDSTLQLIDEVASSQEGLAAEEALILRGYVFLLGGWFVFWEELTGYLFLN